MTSSFDENLFPPKKIFSLGNNKGHFMLDPISKDRCKAVSTVIRGFLPWKPLTRKGRIVLGETIFFSNNVAVFLPFSSLAG